MLSKEFLAICYKVLKSNMREYLSGYWLGVGEMIGLEMGPNVELR